MNLIAIPLLYIIYKILFLRQSAVSDWRFFIPFSLYLSSSVKNLQNFSEKLKYFLIECFLILSAILVSTSFQLDFWNALSISFVSILLMYLSIYDIFTFSVPAAITRFGLMMVVVINIIAAAIRIISPYIAQQQSSFLSEWGNPSNLLGGLLIGLIFWIIIKVTKEKGLGLGDLDIVMIIGFSLGFPLVLAAFYYTLISATVFGIALSIYLKKFHGLIIPFVPFLSLGYFLVIAFGTQLIFQLSI